MASNRSRSNRSIGNKLNNLDSRVSSNEKGTKNPHLSPDVIEEQHLVDGSVAEGKLADRAITENKIARGAVGTEHLGIVNTVTADSGLTLKPGPDGGFIVIDGPEYVAPAAGSGDLYALAFNELNQVVVSTSGVGGGDGVAAMPAGSIQAWPTTTAPEGWLVCDGSAVSRTTYSALFNVLIQTIGTGTFNPTAGFTFSTTESYNKVRYGDSVYFTTTGTLPTGLSANTLYYIGGLVPNSAVLYTTRTATATGYAVSNAVNFSGTGAGTHTIWHAPYGNGDGSTTFNVPDIRGRVVVGYDQSQAEFNTLGEKGGNKTHTLAIEEMPVHSHSGAIGSAGDHSHYITTYNDDFNDIGGDGGAGPSFSKRNDSPGSTRNTGTNTTGAHTHTFTGGSAGGYLGTTQAHNNLQPYIALTYIIKHMVADGMQGPQGLQGETGDAATVAVGSTTTGIPGSIATVTNSGTTSAAVLEFTIPRGNTGATGGTGPQGPSGTVAVGSTSTGAEGTDAAVTNSGTSTNAVLEFVIPRGNAATVAVGTTTTGAPGTDAEVTNSGDGHAAIFDFVIPEGIGATADVGTVTTVTEDDAATVTNSGTTVDAIFDFEIPQGITGDSAGVQFTFSSDTADTDPTDGKLKFDSATPASITYLYIDNVDADGANHTAWYEQWDTSTSQTKGTIYVGEYRSDSVAVFNVTNIVTAATGYYKVPVEYVSGNLPAADAVCYVTFAAQGNIGNETPYGGDAGQILSKASNADYDFVWIDNYADWTSQVKHRVKAAEALTKGQAVYVTGADGTNMLVSKASNATEATSSKTMGLIMQSLSTDGQGYVITEGLLSGLNTSTATQGDPVWLGTNGNLIYGLANKPYAPAHLVFIGIVTRVNLNNGEIWVKVQNGFELKELHDVLITNPTNGQALAYDSVSGLWINTTPATTLDSLTDVELTAPLEDGQALTYDLATETWINATPASTLEDLTDVTLTTPLVDKQVLKYDDATSQWINAVATGGVTVSATAPAEPYPGDAWYDSTDGSMYVYYDDEIGSPSAQWVEVKSTAVPTNFSGVEARVTTAENDIVALESDVATLQSTQILTSNVNTFTANQNFSASGTFINGDNGTLTAKTSSAGKVPVIAQGASGQYANLQEWSDSTGSVLSKVDSLGRITQSAVPAFSVQGTGSQSWSGGAVPAKVAMQGTVFANRGGHYSTTNSRFTAPIAGVYQFHMSSCVTTNATGPEIWVYKNGSVVNSVLAIGYDAFYNTFGSTIVLDLSVNDFVEMYIQNNNGTSFTIDRGRSMFSGSLIG